MIRFGSYRGVYSSLSPLGRSISPEIDLDKAFRPGANRDIFLSSSAFPPLENQNPAPPIVGTVSVSPSPSLPVDNSTSSHYPLVHIPYSSASFIQSGHNRLSDNFITIPEMHASFNALVAFLKNSNNNSKQKKQMRDKLLKDFCKEFSRLNPGKPQKQAIESFVAEMQKIDSSFRFNRSTARGILWDKDEKPYSNKSMNPPANT